MSVKFESNAAEVKKQMEQNITAALTAMGLEGVNMIVSQMQTGYPTPIYDTGDLQRDVNFAVDTGREVVIVGNEGVIGNSMEYAPYVHEGTAKMPSRPYIKDAIVNNSTNKKALQQIAADQLKRGFE